MHLVISKKNELITPAPSVSLMVNHIFSISIISFMQEIILAAGKYYKELLIDNTLQINFDKALNDIFSIYLKKTI